MAEGSEALQAWAWEQSIPPEWKLVLLALCTGETEPDLEGAKRRTLIPFAMFNTILTELHRVDLIDADHRPVGPFG